MSRRGAAAGTTPKQFPYTFGFQPDYTVEGEIQGQYVEQYDPGKAVGYLVEADEFGHEGEKGLDLQVPADQIVSRQTYAPATLDVAPRSAPSRRLGRRSSSPIRCRPSPPGP